MQSRLANLGGEIFPREQQTPEVPDALAKGGAETAHQGIRDQGRMRKRVLQLGVIALRQPRLAHPINAMLGVLRSSLG
jgi:hypothetical protein